MTGMVILATFLGFLLIVAAVLFWRYQNKQSDPNSCECRKCGTELAEEDETCPGCGNPTAGNRKFRRVVVEKFSIVDSVGKTLTRAWDSNVLTVFFGIVGILLFFFVELEPEMDRGSKAILFIGMALLLLAFFRVRALRNPIIGSIRWLLKLK